MSKIKELIVPLKVDQELEDIYALDNIMLYCDINLAI